MNGEEEDLFAERKEDTSLQEVADRLMAQPDQLSQEDVKNLKTGICYRWYHNNFECPFPACHFEHNVSDYHSCMCFSDYSKMVQSQKVFKRKDGAVKKNTAVYMKTYEMARNFKKKILEKFQSPKFLQQEIFTRNSDRRKILRPKFSRGKNIVKSKNFRPKIPTQNS